MKWIKPLRLFKESIEPVKKEPVKKAYNSKNLISEMCVSMVLLNNEFLDPLLDRNQKARYTENSQVFLTDLKNFLLSKTRLTLGKFEGNRCVADSEISKINEIFNSPIEFSMEDDWSTLINARITARNIVDKLFVGEKLKPGQISKVYWIGPNKTKDDNEDIVIETKDGAQYSFYLNKNFSSKTSSFSLLAEEFIGTDTDNLYKGEYLMKWDKLAQSWCKILHDNANPNIKSHIEKFINAEKIGNMGWFEYFNIKHGGEKFRHLGEYIKEFDKNVLYLSDLMKLIWKDREECFMDPKRVYEEWSRTKTYVLNARILQHILTENLKEKYLNDVIKEKDFKVALGKLKMRIAKIIINKLGCKEKNLYFLSNNGNIFHQIPSREFFRKNFESLSTKFDYHQHLNQVVTEEIGNDFFIKLKMEMDNKEFIDCNIEIKFSGGDISDKLSARFNYKFADNFNSIVSDKNVPIVRVEEPKVEEPSPETSEQSKPEIVVQPKE